MNRHIPGIALLVGMILIGRIVGSYELDAVIGARDVMNVPLRTTSLMSPRLHETSCEIVWPGDCATASS